VKRSTQRAMCAGILVLEGVVLFLTGVVSIGLTDLGTGTALGMGVGLGVLCVLAAGMLGRPFGYALGWLVQVVALGLGFVVATMFFLGAVFAGLWAAAYFLGRRIDEEKAQRQVAEEQWRAEHEAGH
jgi:hypothetical protein